MSVHLDDVLSGCASSMYALWALRAHGSMVSQNVHPSCRYSQDVDITYVCMHAFLRGGATRWLVTDPESGTLQTRRQAYVAVTSPFTTRADNLGEEADELLFREILGDPRYVFRKHLSVGLHVASVFFLYPDSLVSQSSSTSRNVMVLRTIKNSQLIFYVQHDQCSKPTNIVIGRIYCNITRKHSQIQTTDNDLTTVPHSTQIFLPFAQDASNGLLALLRATQEAFLELDTYLATCQMYSTGYLSSSGLLPWSGGVSWALLWCIPARSLLSHPGNQKSQLPPLNGTGLLFVPLASSCTMQTRAFSVVGPSVWNGLPLALRLLPKVHSDTLALNLFFLAVQGSGALLSSNLEDALCKSP